MRLFRPRAASFPRSHRRDRRCRPTRPKPCCSYQEHLRTFDCHARSRRSPRNGARICAGGRRRYGSCNRNTSGLVDAKHKIIVDQEVTNQVVDMGLLTPTAEPARAILAVETIDVVADRGYFKIEDIEACETAGMTPYVPKPQRGSSVSNGFFRKDEFRYDA